MRSVRYELAVNLRRLMQLGCVLVLLAFLGEATQAADPGVSVPTNANVSSVKTGSVLFFNLYSSNVVDTNGIEETEISLVNTGPDITVRLFLVNGATGAARSEYFCLGPNQMISLLASQLDPGVSGYAVAVAVDRTTGCPISHNFLAGDAYIRLVTGHRAKLNAVAVAANFSGQLSSCNAGATSATIAFDGSGAGYNRVPRALAVQSIPSRGDGNDTMVVINRVGGNLGTSAQSIGAISGLLSDDAANDLSFTSTLSGSQFRSSLRNNSFPPIGLPFDTFISAGRTGWMRFWAQSDVGLLGAVLNLNPNAFAAAGAFNGGENLRVLTLATASSYTIPVSPLNCASRPLLTRLSPGAAARGSAALTLTVDGRGFTNGAAVRWNGANRTTSFVSATRLTAAITAADLAAVGVAEITVVNAAGNPASNTLRFSVTGASTSNPCDTLTPINVGQTLTGSLGTGDCQLNDGSFADLYTFSGVAGQQIAINLDSAGFDAYLFLVNASGNVIAEDDDGGGGTNARIPAGSGFFTLPAAGNYVIAANSFEAGQSGAYTLKLTGSVTCSYTIAPINQSFSAAAGNGMVNVTAAAGCAWQATSNDSWLTITTGSNGTGNGVVSYSVAANNSTTARTGTLTVAGQTVTVMQAGANPVPSLTSMTPNTARAGDGAFTMTLTGMNFVNGAMVRWNGGDRPTVFVSGTQLTATIGAADLATAGTANVTVFNPAPGGGLSNSLPFNIASVVSAVSSVSAASFTGTTLAAESIVAAFGGGLATRVLSAGTVPLPTSLAGTTVEVRDGIGATRLAPLFFVAPSQVNYQVPPGTAVGTASVKVTASDGKIAQGTVQIAAVAPGIFSANASGQGVVAGVVLRVKANGLQSYEPLAQFDAAQGGFVALPLDLGPEGEQIYLILYGTGIRGRSALSAVRVRIGGVDAQVLYAGAINDFVGLDQLNVLVPRSLAGRGEIDIVVTVDNQTANTVRVRFK